MNEGQRKQLRKLSDDLRDILDQIESQRDEEEEKYENLSEGLREAESGQAIKEAAEALVRALFY